MPGDLVVFTLRVPKKLLEELDAQVDKQKETDPSANRSRLIRDFIMEGLKGLQQGSS